MDALKVQLTVVDDKGQLVSYATVGAIIVRPIESYSSPFNALAPDDMWRTLTRNPGAWEYWNNYINPQKYLTLVGLTDTSGSLMDTIDYGDIAARKNGKPQPLPDTLIITYAVYKQGYEPVQQGLVAKKKDQKLSLRIVLKRAPDCLAEEKPYIRTLNEVRKEISDWRANEEISRKNRDRLEGLRQRLETAAQQAIDANDQKAAAHIFYWVAHMPEVSEIDDKFVGYAQTNEQSPRNIAALKKAAELDPTNYHIQSQWLVLEDNVNARNHNLLKLTTDAEWTHQREDWLRRAEKLDKAAGNTLWPGIHSIMANTYGYLGWVAASEKRYGDAAEYYQKKYNKTLWIQTYEPKWHDFRKELPVIEEQVKKYRNMKTR